MDTENNITRPSTTLYNNNNAKTIQVKNILEVLYVLDLYFAQINLEFINHGTWCPDFGIVHLIDM